MRIREILKVGDEFKEKIQNLRIANYYDLSTISNDYNFEENPRIIEESQNFRETFNDEDLYFAILAEDSADKKFKKDDLILFSNSKNMEKECLVVCKYKNEFLLANYFENEIDETKYNVEPILENYPKLSHNDKDDLKIYGMVLQLNRLGAG